MGALAIFEDQKKEMHKALKMLFKTGELVLEDEDFEKTEYLLQLHPTMMSVIKNDEWSQANKENGMSQFESLNAEGGARRGEHGTELNSDVTADSVVLKHKAAAIYQLYKTISDTICIVINNLKDPHEELIFKLLFIDGKKASKDAIIELLRERIKELESENKRFKEDNQRLQGKLYEMI